MLAWSRLADAAAGGLIVLAVGSLAARLCRQPVRRARLVVLTLLGAHGRPLPGRPAGRPSVVGRAPRGAGRAPSLAPTMRPPPMRRSRLHPPEAAGSRVALEPIERPGEMPTGHARTGPRPRLLGAGEALARGAVDISPRADGPARELFRRGGRVGGLVARRAGRALAGDPVGSPGPGGGPRRLPRPRRARGRAGRPARKRPDRPAVHLHLASVR